MSLAKKLAFIATGYALAVICGLVAVGVNDARITSDVMQTSGGMVAFGDMVLLLLVAGFCGLIPTWFLIKLALEKTPRTLFAFEMLIAVMGPVSWLTLTYVSIGATPTNMRQSFGGLLGFFIAFCAIPRMVFGPILLAIEGATFLLVRDRRTRVLLVAAALLDIIPLGISTLRMSAVLGSLAAR